MSELIVPAAVWACKQPGVPLVAGIVDEVLVGVPHAKIVDGTATPADAFGPPADLVALRDARCECVNGRIVFDTDGDQGPCLDCVDGRLLVDVRVEMIAYSYHGDPCPCGLPADEHYRTVKGLVDVVPVVDVACPGKTNDAHRPAHLHVSFDDAVGLHVENSDLIWDSPWKASNRLTPAHVDALGTIQPGQWAWLFTEITR